MQNFFRVSHLLLHKTSGLLTLLFFVSVMAFSQSPIPRDPNEVIIERGLGDQIFSFNVGTLVPLFSYNPNQVDTKVEPLFSFTDRRLSLGVIGTIRWGAFVTPAINLGADVSWAFNFGANGDMLSQFSPIQPRISGYLVRSGIIEVPVHLALGMNIMSYKESTMVTPVVKTGASVLWNTREDWAFGFNINYWIVPELYPSGSPIGISGNRIGNFLEVSASALYNF